MNPAVRVAVDRDLALQRLQGAQAHAADGATVAEMAAGCVLLDLVEDGRPVGAVAVEITGQVATIKAAASHGRDTYDELELIEHGLRNLGVRLVGLHTRRPGLLRQLARAGYRIRSAELEKDL